MHASITNMVFVKHVRRRRLRALHDLNELGVWTRLSERECIAIGVTLECKQSAYAYDKDVVLEGLVDLPLERKLSFPRDALARRSGDPSL